MERKEIRERVEKILLKHEENTSEGSIYWDFEWVGGKRIPTGGGGYRQEGGEAVYADKAFYEEMTDFISQELDKAREEQFTQQELKRIKELLGFMLSDYPSSFWKPEDKSIEKKLSKLKDNK